MISHAAARIINTYFLFPFQTVSACGLPALYRVGVAQTGEREEN